MAIQFDITKEFNNEVKMDNKLKYNFSDFTEEHYKELIQIAKKNHEFIAYESALTHNSNFVLWRHDVDLSPQRALALAKIEHEEQVKSTYFVQLTSEFYSVFEKPIKDIFKQIIGLGHDIGVHFYPFAYNVSDKKSLEEALNFEKATLEQLLNTKIKVFSYHNPVAEILEFDDFTYAGLINTYATFFKEGTQYCSDSNGYWRFHRMKDFLENHTTSKLQILTHPEWWQEKEMSPTDRVWRCVNGRAENLKKEYVELLTSMGRSVIR